MNLKKNRLLAASAAVSALLILVGCSTAPPGGDAQPAEDCTPRDADLTTMTDGTLTVAQYEYPPFSMSDGPSTLTGLEGDILTKFAEAQCLTLTVNKGDSAAMITSVATGRADTTLGSWYRTKERDEMVRLSAPVIISPFSSVTKDGASTVDELAALKIGVGQGLVGVDKLKEVLGDSLSIYQNDDATYDDIKAGRVDGTVQGFIAAHTYLDKHGITDFQVTVLDADDRLPATLDPGQTNFPVNKENEALGEAIDSFIAELRESGELDAIAEEYGLDPQVMHPGDPNLL
ncbi:ABC transporter substrate-binding protein [Leucobacter rhizosphaerae]|uniref:ABC transporter substrate-binding protein n=1 Tax=Leucobacter rhizosphaerae TaxID=2932245 RepID=A0ABY4FZR1_9MICO|nr:ABC transporter substrate-binding protein [Leucobacter rhizosphaerae]UOQ61802.1 ABC transporter substrate-binding protein [Leucobacter rhizosphaerae]